MKQKMKRKFKIRKNTKYSAAILLLMTIAFLGGNGLQKILEKDSQINDSVQSVLFSDESQKYSEEQNTSATKEEYRPQIIDSNFKYDEQIYINLANLDFKNNENCVYSVNTSKSTLDLNEWTDNKILFGDLDELNRTTKLTAYLDNKNLGASEGRERQRWSPTGWHQKYVDNQPIVNRGHLLAYTLSFNFDEDGNFKYGEAGSEDNPKNLATQSSFSNQKVQVKFEDQVRQAMKIPNNKVIYQAITVFRENELMPRGFWIQAKDLMGEVDFNVFIFNVQPQIRFNYSDGTSEIDKEFNINQEYN